MGRSLNLLAILCLLFLNACADIENEHGKITDGFYSFLSSGGYRLGVPNGFGYSELAPSHEYYYFGYPDGNQWNLETIDLYYPINSHCTSTLTGASQVNPISNTNGAWGKVDFFKQFTSEGGMIDYEGERPLCAQPGPTTFRYVFCSQRGERTVVVCINQMTDNPALAEQIFSTFRWTK